MVAVLVPSPTISPVFSAACRSMRAPRFSSGSSRSNSLAMVTPSLHTSGAPHFFSIRTDFDLGPNVTRIASASFVAPRRILSRAAERKRTCLCGIGCGLFEEFEISLHAGRVRRWFGGAPGDGPGGRAGGQVWGFRPVQRMAGHLAGSEEGRTRRDQARGQGWRADPPDLA